jgi:hypothetical protein
MKAGKIILGVLLLIGAGSEYVRASRAMETLFDVGIISGVVVILLVCTWLIGSGLTKEKLKFKSLNFFKFFTLSFIVFYFIAHVSLFSNKDNSKILAEIGVSTKEGFKIVDDDFEITFPNQPVDKIDSTSYNKSRRIIYVAKGKDDNLRYELSYIEYQDNMYHSDSLESIEFDLDYTQIDLAYSDSLELTNSNYSSVAGYPAKEFRYKTVTNDKRIRVFVIFVKNRVYTIRVDTEESKNYNKHINQFIKSFQLRNIKENIPPFLSLPTEDEMNNPPFIVNFQGKTERRIQVRESLYGKTAFIFEVNEVKDMWSGIFLLGVGYAKIPVNDTISKEERLALISGIEGSAYSGYKMINSETIKENDYIGKRLVSNYYLANSLMRDIRVMFVTKENIYIEIVAIVIEKKPISKKVDSFFNSFYIKDNYTYNRN